jgi:hypothetical protein
VKELEMSDVPRPLTIEFSAQPGERFEQLRTAFEALKTAKADNSFEDEDPAWLRYFDDDARRFFLWSDTCIGKPEGTTWGKSGWYFWSMIHALYNGEYDLHSCEMVSAGRAELRFCEHAYPFGGTASLRVLIECFGFTPQRDWDGEQFHTWEEIEDAYRRMGK